MKNSITTQFFLAAIALHFNNIVSGSICAWGGFCLTNADCVPNSICAIQNQYFSQCVPQPPPNTCLPDYQQCNTNTLQCCQSSVCTVISSSYSQCIPIPCTYPSGFPTGSTTTAPSLGPSSSKAPKLNPSVTPSKSPSVAPSKVPSVAPSSRPSLGPTFSPSSAPSYARKNNIFIYFFKIFLLNLIFYISPSFCSPQLGFYRTLSKFFVYAANYS